jgi:FMN phosphatase YigB (HAD superfamily)
MALPQLNLHPIKIVSFDIWRTIISINPEFQTRRKLLYFNALSGKKAGVPFEDFNRIFDEVQKSSEMKSEAEGLHKGFEERVSELCRALNISRPSATALADLRSKQTDLCKLHAAPLMSTKIVNLFEAIRQSGRKIALLSNTGLVDSETVLELLDTHGIKKYVTYTIFSDKNNFAKPNPRFFEELLNSSGEVPPNILHVGDSLNADYNGAITTGMSALHLCLDNAGVLKLSQLLGLETK